MNKHEKENYMNKDSIAYYSGFGGIEIKTIEYGINDSVIFVSGAWCSNKSVHKARIYYGNNKTYFHYGNYRIPFDECIRM